MEMTVIRLKFCFQEKEVRLSGENINGVGSLMCVSLHKQPM